MWETSKKPLPSCCCIVDKFISQEVQNELLAILSKDVISTLLEDIRPNLYFIISNEYTHVSNKKLLPFCLQWVSEIIEVFLEISGLLRNVDIKSSTIVSVTKDIFTQINHNLDLCRRQCYDGTKRMVRKISRVALQIKQLQTKAEFFHYHAHLLSLSVKDVTKSVKTLMNLWLQQKKSSR